MRIKVIPYNTLEYASLASFPQSGETGKNYLALDTMLLYSWNGTAYVSAPFRYEGKPTYHGSYLRSGYLEYQVASSPSPTEWHNGDYVRYSRTGRVYKMYSVPQTERQAATSRSGESFAYRNVQFYDAVKELELVPFRDYIKESNEFFFSSRQDVATTEPLSGIVDRINANLADYYGEGVWNIAVADNIPPSYEITEAKDVTVSGNCLDALNAVYEAWHELGWAFSIVEGVNTITVGYPNVSPDTTGNRTNQFSYGNGLTALKRSTSGLEEFCTRMRVFGTERNMPNRYYNNKDIYDAASVYIPNLMIPLEHWGTTDDKPDASKAYIEDADKIEEYGLITKDVYFDGSNGKEEVFPSIENQTISMVKAVKTALGKTGAGYPDYFPQSESGTDRIDEIISAIVPSDNTTGSFTVKIRQIGFDISKCKATDGATISFKSGMCAGRDFGITGAAYNASDDTWTLTCHRTQDNSTSDVYPNTRFPLAAGDRFVILGIEMPEEYVLVQAERLYTLGTELFNKASSHKNSYEPAIDSKKVCENIASNPGDDSYILLEGKYMPLYDADIIGTEDHTAEILIAELTISESEAEIATYRVTLSDKVNISNTLTGMIESAVQSVSIPDAGSLVKPVYFRGGKPQVINGLDVPEDVHSDKNVTADGGVSAQGIADLSIGGGGDLPGGRVTEIDLGDTPYTPDSSGKVQLPAYPDVPTVVGYNSLNESEAENLHKTPSAYAAARMKADIGMDEYLATLDFYDPDHTEAYKRGDEFKIQRSDGSIVGYRVRLPIEPGAAIGNKAERITYGTLLHPLEIVGIENILVF